MTHELALALDDEVVSVDNFGEGLKRVSKDEYSVLEVG